MRALWSDRQNCSHNVSQKVKRIRRFSEKNLGGGRTYAGRKSASEKALSRKFLDPSNRASGLLNLRFWTGKEQHQRGVEKAPKQGGVHNLFWEGCPS